MRKQLILLCLPSFMFCVGGLQGYAESPSEIYDYESFFLETSQGGQEYFETEVLPRLNATCARCHDHPAPDYDSANQLIVPGNPEESILYQKASGQGHAKVWRNQPESLEKLRNWILMEGEQSDLNFLENE